jgi:hypothetical protein
MKRFEVAKVEGSVEQVTIDLVNLAIVDGFLENGGHPLSLRSGEQIFICVKDGHFAEAV